MSNLRQLQQCSFPTCTNPNPQFTQYRRMCTVCRNKQSSVYQRLLRCKKQLDKLQQQNPGPLTPDKIKIEYLQSLIVSIDKEYQQYSANERIVKQNQLVDT